MYSRGFTLVEVLIAVSLTALLFTGIITIVGSAIQTGESARKTLSALPEEAKLYEILSRLTARPAERVDSISPLSSSTGGIWNQDNEYISVGTAARTGYCANDPTRMLDFLQVRLSPYPVSSESRSFGVYSLSDDGTRVYSGSVAILGTGIPGKSLSSPLLSEFESNSLVGTGSILIFSDPRSDRIIFYTTSDGSISSWDLGKYGILGGSSLSLSGNRLMIGAANGGFSIEPSTPANSVAENFKGPTTALPGIAGYRIQFDGVTALTSPSTPAGSVLSCSSSCLTLNSTEDTIALSGSGFTYSFTGSAQNIPADATLEINIASVTPLPTAPGKYIAEFSLIDSGGLALWSTLIPFREVGDGSLWTLADNSITRTSENKWVRSTGGSYLSGSLDYTLQSSTGAQVFTSQ
jgi:prepilin-type N-terminal cleavage/methylation domain-containing protein